MVPIVILPNIVTKSDMSGIPMEKDINNWLDITFISTLGDKNLY